MKKIVAGNLKMNLNSFQERENYLNLLKKELIGQTLADVELILLPPFIHLEAFRKSLSKKIGIGAQNFFFESRGPFTGEISPLMLYRLGCKYALVGHSERRRYFLEKNDEINLKVIAAMKNGISPILCVGETKVEKENQETLKVISTQLKECLRDVSRTRLEKIVVAYEPVWAVGTDVTPSAHDIMEAKVLIRKVLLEIFGKKYAQSVRIIYGGSVNAKNLDEVCLKPEMDGVLVGRETLLPHEFIKIVKTLSS